MKRILLAGALIALFLSTGLQSARAHTSHATSRASSTDRAAVIKRLGTTLYCFHHYVYARYGAGKFNPHAKGQIVNLVKAAVALGYAQAQLKAAVALTQRHAGMRPLRAPLQAALKVYSHALVHFRTARYHPADIHVLATRTSAMKGAAARIGLRIKDVRVVVPGAG